MAMRTGTWRECECLRRLEEQFNLLIDCYYGAGELARVPLRCGIRAWEAEGKVIVEIAMPFAVTAAEVEIGMRGRELVVQYRGPEARETREFVVALWCDVDADRAEAEGVGQVLVVRLPMQESKTRRIMVEGG